MNFVMSMKTSRNMAIMICIDTLMVVLTVFFEILYCKFGQGWMQTLYITFLTVSYHFLMRLIVGEIISVRYRNRKFDLNSIGFRMHNFESELYKRLQVKKWKKNIITAKPEQFDISKNSMEAMLHNIAQAELVHRIIFVLSFVPLVLIIPYGAPIIFIMTSIFACLIDLQFVIVQRYNRPRVIKLIEMMKNNEQNNGHRLFWER